MKEKILKVIKKYNLKTKLIKTFENSGENILNLEDLFELGLSGTANSKELRTHVSEHYNIGYCNAKQMLFRLNCLNVTKQELEEVIKNVRH